MMRAGMFVRMSMAMTMLFGLLFAFMIALAFFVGFGVVGAVALTFLFVLFQWGIGPFIIKWIYHIEWYDYEYIPENLRNVIDKVVAQYGIKPPKFGIVPDSNPNAFAFGWTKNKAHVVLTRGIIEYCNEDEQDAVLAHELGHVVHNDFVVMTIVYAIPLIFYNIYLFARIGLRGLSRGGGKDKGQVAILFIVVMAVSYLVYLFGHFISLLISRYREYWADHFAAEVTENPNALSFALVKIAYGLATEGKKDEDKKGHGKYQNPLMISDARSARGVAYNAVTTNATGETGLSIDSIKKAMTWDLWNPWGFVLELQMSHPLPAKRILALENYAEEIGQEPMIRFDYKKQESYIDEFLIDLFSKYSFLLVLMPIIILAMRGLDMTGGDYIGMFIFTWAFFGLLYYLKYRYPTGFLEEDAKNLIMNPKASPIRGIPVILKGRIIGRGQPGLFYSEDMKLDDGTGLMLLDYNQIAGIINFFIGMFGTAKFIDRQTTVYGWYRRAVVPYVEVYRMEFDDKTRKVWTTKVYKGLAVFGTILGLFLMAGGNLFADMLFLSPLIAMIFMFYSFVGWKYKDEKLDSMVFHEDEATSEEMREKYEHLNIARRYSYGALFAVMTFIAAVFIMASVLEPVLKEIAEDEYEYKTSIVYTDTDTISEGIQMEYTNYLIPEGTINMTISVSWVDDDSGIIPGLGDDTFGLEAVSSIYPLRSINGTGGLIELEYPGLDTTSDTLWDFNVIMINALPDASINPDTGNQYTVNITRDYKVKV